MPLMYTKPRVFPNCLEFFPCCYCSSKEWGLLSIYSSNWESSPQTLELGLRPAWHAEQPGRRDSPEQGKSSQRWLPVRPLPTSLTAGSVEAGQLGSPWGVKRVQMEGWRTGFEKLSALRAFKNNRHTNALKAWAPREAQDFWGGGRSTRGEPTA